MKKIAFTLAALATVSTADARSRNFIPEASGICRVGGAYVIAGDETPKSLWIADEMTHALKAVKLKNAKWDDMEDLSTVDENRFFAVTSHSRTKKGKRKPEREQLMLIAKDSSGLTLQRSWSLRDQILGALRSNVGADLNLDTVESASPDNGGLNIEGLAYHEGRLYLGLRSPLTHRGEALTLVIENGKALLEGAAPRISRVLRMSLSGRGIRALTSHSRGLLVLGGSSNDVHETFSLHHFDVATNRMREFPLNGFDALERPEGIVADSNGSFTFVQDFEEEPGQDVIVRLTR